MRNLHKDNGLLSFTENISAPTTMMACMEGSYSIVSHMVVFADSLGM